jgi:hypothetical protein
MQSTAGAYNITVICRALLVPTIFTVICRALLVPTIFTVVLAIVVRNPELFNVHRTK